MNTNEVLAGVHEAAVKKVAVKCAAEGSAKRAVEIGNAIMAYGKLWTEGFADDGRLDAAEIAKIQEGFERILAEYVPTMEGPAVAVAYNGLDSWILKLFRMEFKGIKHYLNLWFGLDLA